MASISRDAIIELLKNRGPLVPNEIKKVLGGDTIIIGATLAELSSRKLVRITHAKRGGSPYYYLPGQEAELENIISQLPAREQEIIELLRKERVLQDNKLEVYQRAELRQLKDFAKEFQANTVQGEILFWRYFTISLDDAIAILNERFSPKEEPQPSKDEGQSQLTDVPETNTSQTAQTQSTEQEENQQSEPLNLVQEPNSSFKIESEEAVKEASAVSIEANNGANSESNDGLRNETSNESVPATQTSEEVSVFESVSDEIPSEQIKELEPEFVPETTNEDNGTESFEQEIEQEMNISKQNMPNTPSTHFEDEGQEHIIIEPALEETEFYKEVLRYFDEKGIKMLSEEQLSKDREYEFIVKIPAAVGSLTFLCRAKKGKRLSEKDVAPALLKAKNRNIFCLFLTPGEFTKKSKELMVKEYTGLIIKQL